MHQRRPTLALIAAGFAGLALVTTLTGAPTATAAASERGPVARSIPAAEDPTNARVIVRFKAGSGLMRSPKAGPQHAATLAGRTGLLLRDGRRLDAQTQVVHGQGLSSSQLRARLAADPDVESVVVDQRRHALAVVNDPLFPAQTDGVTTPTVGQWYLQAPPAGSAGSTVAVAGLSAINAVGAWATTHGSNTLTVAIIDTGVRFDHPDLVGKFWPGPAGAAYGYGYDFISDAGTAGDGNARDDDASDTGDWTTTNECGRGVRATDSSWHGTQVSGLIAANTDNGIGMASVGRDVMLLPLRALGKCGGFDSDIVAAMQWAGGLSVPGVPANQHPARVINLSLGGTDSGNDCVNLGYNAAVSQLAARGVVVVAAAGNEEGLAAYIPAKCPGVIGVAAVRHIGTKVGFSSIGPELTIAAPGGNCVNLSGACLYPLLTTVNSGTTIPATNTWSDSVNASLGTSFSSPLVAGTVALMLSVSPSLTPAQVKSALQATARPFPTSGAANDIVTHLPIVACEAPSSTAQDECYCTTTTCGAGLLDVAAAVARAAATATPVPHITTPATTVEVGAALNFDGTTSAAASGRSVTGYQWAISAGSGIAAITSATNAATARVATSGAGSFTVSLSVTDNLNIASAAPATQTVTVLAPAPPTAQISATPASPSAGQAVSVSSAGSTAIATRTITGYQWSISAGSGIATISGSATGPTASVATSAAGTFTVALQITDSTGAQASASQVVTVQAAPVTPQPTGGGGGGGGGALDGRWLLGLALAVSALAVSGGRRERRTVG
jgi:serine protease